MSDSDLAWARAIIRAADLAEVRCPPLHFANDVEVQVSSLDDLGLPPFGGMKLTHGRTAHKSDLPASRR